MYVMYVWEVKKFLVVQNIALSTVWIFFLVDTNAKLNVANHMSATEIANMFFHVDINANANVVTAVMIISILFANNASLMKNQIPGLIAKFAEECLWIENQLNHVNTDATLSARNVILLAMH